MFSAIHPRWTVPFAYNWSRHSRKVEGPSQEDAERMMENITEFSREFKRVHPDVEYFIYGHLHLFVERQVAEGATMVVLGEWISRRSYARWDGSSLTLHTYDK